MPQFLAVTAAFRKDGLPANSASRHGRSGFWRQRLYRPAAALVAGLCLWAGSFVPAPAHAEGASHAVTLFGQPKYPAGFGHFDYVNPDAPKGGELRLAQVGGFDSLNPFSGTPPYARGTGPRPIDLLGLTFDSLLVRSADEPASAYGLLAESVEIAPDGRWAVFNLRGNARFHNGAAVTADDVLFSINVLKASGPPAVQAALDGVERAEKLADRKVRLVMAAGAGRAAVLAAGGVPMLSRADWQGRDMSAPSLRAPEGSGPYAVATADAGKELLLTRVEDYWAKDLPATKGLNNFNRIRTLFYADPQAAFTAFTAGAYDIRYEFESKKWATAYRFPAVARGQVILQSLPVRRMEPMRGFAFNLRRPLWQDRRVREALSLAFDFEKLNRTLLFGQYVRTTSYFSNSDWAADGAGSDPAADTGTAGHADLKAAARLLDDAGLALRHGRRTDPRTGQPVAIEILVDNPAWQPICRPFLAALKRLGIRATLKTVSVDDHLSRLRTFDFDMATAHWPPVSWPGTDLSLFWGSAAADMKGSLNWPGIKDPAIDEAIGAVAAAPDQQSLVDRARALDRLLMGGIYVIPQWHMATDHLAFWNRFFMPVVTPDSGPQLMAWWINPDRPDARPAPTGHGGTGRRHR